MLGTGRSTQGYDMSRRRVWYGGVVVLDISWDVSWKPETRRAHLPAGVEKWERVVIERVGLANRSVATGRHMQMGMGPWYARSRLWRA